MQTPAEQPQPEQLKLTASQQKQYDYLLNLITKQAKSEAQLQSKCAELLYFFYHDHYKRLVCVFNNSLRANTAGFGIVPGASDMYWLADQGQTIYIEFKFGPTAKQSLAQFDWQALCKRLGHDYRVCYSEDAFWKIIGFRPPVEADILNLHWFQWNLITFGKRT